ncbi:hypothetical protein P8452_05756 [Trifolium repens]|nr:hypothetical protein P8452_05756 [Trifolium repens]
MEEVEEEFEELLEAITESPQVQPNASVSADNECSASSHKTPAKRSAAKNVTLDTVGMEVELSSTRKRRYNLK